MAGRIAIFPFGVSEDALPDKIENLVLTDKRIYGRSIVNFYKVEQNSPDSEN